MLKEQNFEDKSQASQLESKERAYHCTVFKLVLFVVSGSGLFNSILNFWIMKNNLKICYSSLYTHKQVLLNYRNYLYRIEQCLFACKVEECMITKTSHFAFLPSYGINSDCYSHLQPFYCSGVLVIQITLPMFPSPYTEKNDTFCLI